MVTDDSNAALPDEEMSEVAIDMTLADSFPASDPPCWTLGVERSQRKRPAVPQVLHPSTKTKSTVNS
jgi:hypothetical protein